jgi:acyl-CoA synthetase (AMP-forming)/AMP-acid ligase II
VQVHVVRVLPTHRAIALASCKSTSYGFCSLIGPQRNVSAVHDWSPRRTPPELAQQYRAEGFWQETTLGALLDPLITADAAKTFRVWSATRPWVGTIGDVHQRARVVAGGLRERGIGPGDVVATQLPNCPEAAAVFWGVALAGATIVPIVHFYGPKETSFIVRESGARLLVSADRFGWLDYEANLPLIQEAAPGLQETVVLSLERPALELGALGGTAPLDEVAVDDPGAIGLIAYTSGTTANPKGVLHSHRSICAEVTQLGRTQAPDQPRAHLNGAPMGHAIGMLGGLLLPIFQGHPIHLTDVWDPTAILAAMREDEVYSGSGATYFLLSLLDHPDLDEDHLAAMRYIGLGGASVPAAVAERATALGISIIRAYGSTEHPSTTGAMHHEPLERRIHTDGHPLAGVELRIVDDDGHAVPGGAPGEIWSRGPDLCAGYSDPALSAEVFDDDGWFHTGDIGVLDDAGWLTITDRKKDIILRGGETISPVEIEEVLARLPAVAEVAVVGAPDERLGERGCAFIRVAPDHDAPTLADLREHLAEVGLAKQKWPEDLRVVDDFPRTASGKIRKVDLRTSLRRR